MSPPLGYVDHGGRSDARPLDKEHFSTEKEIAEEHSAIRAIMRWIEADLERQSASPEGIQGNGPLLGPLRSFRDHLSHHFDFEERSGVLPAAITLLPDGSPTIRKWHGQHRDLLLRLDRSIAMLEEAAKSEGPVRPTFELELHELFVQLRQHDVFENQVLGECRTAEFRTHQRRFERNA